MRINEITTLLKSRELEKLCVVTEVTLQGKWISVSGDPSEDAKILLTNNPDKIHWTTLSQNPSDWALDILERNSDKIKWWFLHKNTNPRTLDIMKRNEGLSISWLSSNSSDWALDILEQNIEEIYWTELCEGNTNIRAIKLLEQNPEYISLSRLSINSRVLEKIYWTPDNHKFFTITDRYYIASYYRILINLLPKEIVKNEILSYL